MNVAKLFKQRAVISAEAHAAHSLKRVVAKNSSFNNEVLIVFEILRACNY